MEQSNGAEAKETHQPGDDRLAVLENKLNQVLSVLASPEPVAEPQRLKSIACERCERPLLAGCKDGARPVHRGNDFMGSWYICENYKAWEADASVSDGEMKGSEPESTVSLSRKADTSSGSKGK